MGAFHVIFYLESLMTFGQGLQAISAPGAWVKLLLQRSGDPPLTLTSTTNTLLLEMLRWAGVMYIVFGIMLAVAVRKDQAAPKASYLAPVLAVFGIGDLLQAVVSWRLAQVMKAYTIPNLATIVVSILLLLARVAWFATARKVRGKRA